MFGYPFRPAVLGWLLGLCLAAGVIQFFTGVLELQWLPRFQVTTSSGVIVFAVIGIALEVFWWVLAFKLAVEALRAAASGREGEAGREDWVDDAQALRQLLMWAGVLFSGYLLYLELGGLVLSLYCVLLALLLPAVLVLLGMEDSLLRAFDVGAWRALVRKAGADYAVVAAKLAFLAVLVVVAELELFAHQPRWLGVPLSRLALLYALVAGYHELGRMLDRHRREFELPEQVRVLRPEAASPEEVIALRAADSYAADHRFGKAAQQLEPLVGGEGAGATAAAHARYRELLGQAGDPNGLLAHARTYVPLLLAKGKDSEALALYQESLALDPGFELDESRRLGQLIALAMGAQQPQLAISLAREFMRRFPHDPEAVANGLSAARLLDRLGHDEEARRLLVDLVRHFPHHPMRGELLAALETLEDAARRGR
jgi:tetratricopeptide (TPR) repeat protein